MTSAENNQLIADVARDIIAQTAPEELPLFRATSAAYFKKSDEVLRKQSSGDEMLGFGLGETITLLTPGVLVVMTQVVTFLTAEIRKSVAEEGAGLINDQVKKMFKRFRSAEMQEEHTPAPLTREQLTWARKLSYEKFIQLKLSDAQANRLADAVVASLVTDFSPEEDL